MVITSQCRIINCNKYTIPVGIVANGGASAFGKSECIWEISAPSPFFCEPKTFLKKKSFQKGDPFIIYKNASHSNKDIYTELCIFKCLQYRKPFKGTISLHSMIKEVQLLVDINRDSMEEKGNKTLSLYYLLWQAIWV